MEICPFCRQQQGEVPVVGGVLYEDHHVYACHLQREGEPTYLGSVQVETKRHVPTYAELTEDEARALGLLVSRISRALKVCTGVEHVYVYFFGEVIPHLHTFVVARYPDAPEAYWRLRVSEWPDAPRGDPAEVAAFCDRLRAALRGVA